MFFPATCLLTMTRGTFPAANCTPPFPRETFCYRADARQQPAAKTRNDLVSLGCWTSFPTKRIRIPFRPRPFEGKRINTMRKRNPYIIPFKLVHVSLRLVQLSFPRITQFTVHADEHVWVCPSIGHITSEHVYTIRVLYKILTRSRISSFYGKLSFYLIEQIKKESPNQVNAQSPVQRWVRLWTLIFMEEGRTFPDHWPSVGETALRFPHGTGNLNVNRLSEDQRPWQCSR